MTERSQYFDSVDGDRIYDSADFSRHLKTLSTDGFVNNFEDELEVSAVSPNDMFVEVGLGGAWVDGRYFEVYSDVETLSIPVADPDNDRIDRVVVRRDLDDREATLDILEGTAAVDPDPPSLTRNSTTWEISLAQVLVSATATEITDSDITDERFDEDVCGVSRHSGFEEVSQDAIFVEVEDTTGEENAGGTTSVIEFDTENYDTDDMWDVGDPTYIVIPSDGLYLVSFQAEIDVLLGDDEERVAKFEINTSRGTNAEQEFPYVNHSGTTASFPRQQGMVSQVYYLQTGDTLQGRIGLIGFESSSDIINASMKVVNLLEVTL